MTAVEVLLKIKALFERKGADEAKEAVDAVGKAGAEAGEAAAAGLSEAADAAKSAGEAAGGPGAEGFNVMGAASAIASGNFAELGKSAADLAGRIGGVRMSMLEMTAAGAAVGAVANLFRAVSEAVEKARVDIDAIRVDNAAAGLDRLQEAFARIKKEMDAVRDASEAEFRNAGKIIDALNREARARLDLEKQKALAAAKDEDERRRVEMRFAGREAEMSRSQEAASVRAGAMRAESRKEEALARIAELERENEILFAGAAEASASGADYAARAGTQLPWYKRPFVSAERQERISDRNRGVADSYNDQAAKSIEAMRQNKDEMAKLRAEIESLDADIEAARIGERAVNVSAEAGDVARADESRRFEEGVKARKAAEAAAAAKAEEDARRRAAEAKVRERIEANQEREAELRGQYAAARERFAPALAAAREKERVERQSAATAGKVYGSFRRQGTDSTAGGYDKIVAGANERAQAASRGVESLERELNATLQAIVDEINRVQADTKAARQQLRSLPN